MTALQISETPFDVAFMFAHVNRHAPATFGVLWVPVGESPPHAPRVRERAIATVTGVNRIVRLRRKGSGYDAAGV
jgi:hypothetical protein